MKDMIKTRTALLLVASVAAFSTFVSCNTDDPLPLINITNVVGADNGNAGDASDIEVFFNKQLDVSAISEYRAIVIKAENAVDFGAAQANAVPVGSFASAVPSDVFPVRGITFTSDITDADGDPIELSRAYKVGVLSVPSNPKNAQSSFLLSENELSLTNNNIITDFSTEIQAGTSSLTMDPEGNIFMGDYNVVAHISSLRTQSFTMRKIATNRGVSEVGGPYELLSGNAHDSQGNRYQSTLYNSGILKITPEGDIAPIATSGEDIWSPDGIYIDDNDELYVADEQQGKIFKIDSEGVTTLFAEVGTRPRGIAADEQGNLYVSHNVEEGRISKITPDGQVSDFGNIPTFFTDNYKASGVTIRMYVGYITYHDQHLYVAGMSTDQIFRFDLQGNMEVFAGSGTRGVPRGGALTANLNRPMGLVFSEDGTKLFVSSCTDTMPQHTQASTPSKILQIEINN